MPITQVLLVEDDADDVAVIREEVARRDCAWQLTHVGRLAAALQRLTQGDIGLVLLDLDLPDSSGLETLRRVVAAAPDIPVLVLTGAQSDTQGLEAMRQQAHDYLVKDRVSTGDIVRSIEYAIERQRGHGKPVPAAEATDSAVTPSDPPYPEFVGHSPCMRALCSSLRRVASSDFDALVVGESGTGKELVARRIHGDSRRRDGPFVPVDCGAIPEDLMESEFFGHERGAFTGASKQRAGFMEQAHGGTLFLDEVGELSPRLQVKLLRALQERSVHRVGGAGWVPVDVRVVAATNRDLEEAVRTGRFRQDLYFRINVVRIAVPSLRERREDIPLLVAHFIAHDAARAVVQLRGIEPEALVALHAYPWPGNVRELRNAVQTALVMSPGPLLRLQDLPPQLAVQAEHAPTDAGFFALREDACARFEHAYLHALLERHGGNVTAVAAAAHLPRGTLYRLMKKHRLKPAGFR